MLSFEGLRELLAKRVAAMDRLEQAKMLHQQLQRKFGPLTETALVFVYAADADLLLEWGERLLTAERLDDVFGD